MGKEKNIFYVILRKSFYVGKDWLVLAFLNCIKKMFLFCQQIKCFISHKIKHRKKSNKTTKTKRNKQSDISHILFIHHHSNNLKIYSQQQEHFI